MVKQAKAMIANRDVSRNAALLRKTAKQSKLVGSNRRTRVTAISSWFRPLQLGQKTFGELDQPIRLVGIAGYELSKRELQDDEQLSLFSANAVRTSRLEHTLDAINERFGGKIRRATD